ncbi:murein transglycosylase A [Legionella cherrii]|uniref:Membrane-bound lytic murein transglycosylase A n=1 Tax=Legionella cherrii TaxID=28084 RepID=A0A0W0S974_9GAMM|nr:murein transglycosylase A [Legionella cherrii]KTC79958.1 membrane-bound lytic murein transglycosylase [Legionella cherrii]VEB38337.1 membrane-bound lytic murein transglycosylase [Legionella cherrii]
MKTKILSITTFLALIALSFSAWWFWSMKKPSTLFRQANFDRLPGWKSADLKKSLQTFQTSCRAFIKQNPEQIVGTEHINLQVKDWQPACNAALKISPTAEKEVRQFFETWFTPVEFTDTGEKPGLFTGYYVPAIKGSYTKSKKYHVPLYETPDDLVTSDLGLFFNDLKNRSIVGRLEGKKLVPYYTRAQINRGALKGKARVLVWINSPIDRLFLEIQGSGVIELENGQNLYVGYDAQNGAPYTAIAGVLIKKGVMTKDNASMQAIKRYLEAHPKQMDKVINKNKSFVFFRKMTEGVALGSQGVALTPGYSLAIDKQWIPMGAPLWLTTTRPDSTNPDENKPLQRLMIAQDTGGAIRGKVRGDVFWGGGEKATLIAGHMKNHGHYWILLPKNAVSRLEKNKLISG